MSEKKIIYPHEHRRPYFPSVRFQLGQGPYPVTVPRPSFIRCFQEMRLGEWGMAALITALPAYAGYRQYRKSKFQSFCSSMAVGLRDIWSNLWRPHWPID